MVDREQQLSCVQMDASGHRAEGNTENTVPDVPTTNPHDHDHHSAQQNTSIHHRSREAGTATKAPSVLRRRLLVSIATILGNFANTTRKDTVPEGNTAVQSTDLVINASEPIYLTEPKLLYQPLKAKPEAKIRAMEGANQEERKAISDKPSRKAHKEMVRPL